MSVVGQAAGSSAEPPSRGAQRVEVDRLRTVVNLEIRALTLHVEVDAVDELHLNGVARFDVTSVGV